MTTTPKKILLSAGEASGDMHAANLVNCVRAVAPDTYFYGMGASLMQNAGVQLIVNANELSLIGGLEILTKFSKIVNAFRAMKQELFNDKPDLLILIDYPGFNLRLAKVAKQAGVKVLYFISPKVWAWNQGRVKKIKQYVDLMAVIFPFEVEFYKQWQVPTVFVGNPLVKLVKPNLTHSEAQQKFGLNPRYKTIGLFPGSRKGEIKRLLPVMLQTAELLKSRDPNLQFVLPIASSLAAADITPYLNNTLSVHLTTDLPYDTMQVCDAIIATSGTVTLEIALMEVPEVIIYRTSWLEYQVAKRVIKIPYVGLCNILAGKHIVRELLQYDATPDKIAAEIERILNDREYRKKMIADLDATKAILTERKADDLAQVVLTTAAN